VNRRERESEREREREREREQKEWERAGESRRETPVPLAPFLYVFFSSSWELALTLFFHCFAQLLPYPPLGDLPDPGIKLLVSPVSPELQVDSLPTKLMDHLKESN